MKQMRKPLSLALVLLLAFAVLITAFAAEDTDPPQESPGNPAAAATTIRLSIDNPMMTVNGQSMNIDENGTAPILQDGRTLLPVRAVVEAMGGDVAWDSPSMTATLTLNGDVITLTIDSATAYLNGSAETLDTAPILQNGRTMLPIRFIAESFGYRVGWDSVSFTATITNSADIDLTGSSGASGGQAAQVYMTTDISPEALIALYEALEKEASGRVAVKISTGEPGGSHFLKPELIKDLVQLVDGTIVESNTAYGGRRASTAMHYQVAEDHGFTAIAPVVILDEEADVGLPVTGGRHLSEDRVGARFTDYDFHIVLSHFKGHAMGGFGGAIKNASIGYASSAGKSLIHSAGASSTSIWGGDQDSFLESMAEAAKAVSDASEGNILYISVMNNLSVDCDCSSNPQAPEMHDIGMLASLDPVALDKACVDLIYAADDNDSASLRRRIESMNGTHTLDYAQEIGLGLLAYELVSIDD